MADRKKTVLLLVHSTLVPPDSASKSDSAASDWRTEYEVQQALRELGHRVIPVGLADDLDVLRTAVAEYQPHIAFNLIEEFNGIAAYDQNLVSFLELISLRYTGCNPRGLMVARDKAMAKKILAFHSIPTPAFEVFTKGAAVKKPKHLEFPLIVKSVSEEASLGISQASIVHDESKLAERVAFMHETIGSDAIAESYIDGRELYVGVLGNSRTEVFPIWELKFDNLPEGSAPIATRRAKWNERYREERQIRSGEAKDLSPALYERVQNLARRAYQVLGLSGYARIDLRMDPNGELYLLEANPNPHIGAREDFAQSAHRQGLKYVELLGRILRLGMNYRAA